MRGLARSARQPPSSPRPTAPASGMFRAMPDTMLRALGWSPLLIHGDPCVLDRWLWLRRHLRGGAARTFDAGCGNGAFSIYAARAGNAVRGGLLLGARAGGRAAPAEQLGVARASTSPIDLRELEQHARGARQLRPDHLPRDDRAPHATTRASCGSLAAMLEPGGRLLLTTPFDRHHPLHTEERDPSPRRGRLPRALRLLAASACGEIAESAGLEVESEGFVSGVVSPEAAPT